MVISSTFATDFYSNAIALPLIGEGWGGGDAARDRRAHDDIIKTKRHRG
jgi:hypothetical protein